MEGLHPWQGCAGDVAPETRQVPLIRQWLAKSLCVQTPPWQVSAVQLRLSAVHLLPAG